MMGEKGVVERPQHIAMSLSNVYGEGGESEIV